MAAFAMPLEMVVMGVFGLGPAELGVILVIALLLLGGSRLAGLGKGTGRAIREFKEETAGLNEVGKKPAVGGSTSADIDRADIARVEQRTEAEIQAEKNQF